MNHETRTLVIAPHSDDAELGCGGYIARLREQDQPVRVLIMLCKTDIRLDGALVSACVREEECGAALGILGVTDSAILYSHQPLNFDLCAEHKSVVVTRLDTEIKAFSPTQVLLPVPSFHQEHQFTYECAVAATRPTKGGNGLTRVLAYEYPAANWGPSSSLSPAQGGLYVDITKTLQKKLTALRCYQSQNIEDPVAMISLNGADTLARFRGLESGFLYAEMFYVMREFCP